MGHRLLPTLLVSLLVSLLLLPALLALPPAAAADGRFSDGHLSVHSDAIEAIAQVGVAGGYPDGTYRPRQSVSRDQMATFLMRAQRLRERSHGFEDVDGGNTHSGAIGAIAAEGITRGCEQDRYCPRDEVTRAQMATFLARALDLPDDPEPSFRDVDPDDVHAPGIRAVAAAGITLGCDDGSRYCPSAPVQRDQMAAFLDRALGLDGPAPCPDLDGPAGATTVGNAVFGFPVSSGVRSGDHLELLSMDLEHSRSARVPVTGNGIAGTATLPRGTRTWATGAHAGTVYAGQDTGGTNLYRFPATDEDDRTVTPVAAVPHGGEFWTLTLDADGDRLWAGTRGHREEELEDDEHVLYRVDDPGGTAGEPRPVVFSHPDLPREGGQRPDVKRLHWDAGSETLFVGLGGSATFPGAARLYALTDLGAADGPAVEDLTPTDIGQDELEIFALDVTDTHVAVGTRSEDRPRLAVYDRDAERWISNDRLPSGEGLPPDERRVDQVALGDGRVVAASFPSGTVWEAPLGEAPESIGPPPGASNTATRFLELDGSTIRGITSQALVWSRTDSTWAVTTFTDRSGSSGLLAPGLAHALAVTDRHVVAGANNSVHARPLDAPSERTVTPIGGEAKALATDGEHVWAASYPGAVLWSLDPEQGTATEVGAWDGRYQRPRDAAYSSHLDRVLVVARTDPAFVSALFMFSPDGSVYDAQRVTDGENRDIRATALATRGNYAYVGTYGAGSAVRGESGGVIAYDLRTLEKVWYARPARGEVVSLEMAGDRLVGAAETNSKGGGHTWFELDTDPDLDPGERVLAAGNDDTRLGRGPLGDAVPLGPVTIGAMGRDVVSIQRGADRATSLYDHDAHETFAGPFVDVDRRGGRCDVYAIEGREIFRLPYDPATRLDR